MIFLRRQHETADADAQFLTFQEFLQPVDMIFISMGGKDIVQSVHGICQKIGFDPVDPS